MVGRIPFESERLIVIQSETSQFGTKSSTGFLIPIRQIKWLKSNTAKHLKTFSFLSFRRVLNAICSFLGNSPASEF